MYFVLIAGYKYSIQTECVVSDSLKADYFHIAIDGNSYTLVRQHFPTVYKRVSHCISLYPFLPPSSSS